MRTVTRISLPLFALAAWLLFIAVCCYFEIPLVPSTIGEWAWVTLCLSTVVAITGLAILGAVEGRVDREALLAVLIFWAAAMAGLCFYELGGVRR